MIPQLTDQNLATLQLMNEGVNQYDSFENLKNELQNTGNGISENQIDLIETQLRVLTRKFEQLNPVGIGIEDASHIYNAAKNKADEIFKKYTVLIKVLPPRGSVLSLRGINGDWETERHLFTDSNGGCVRVPKPLQQNQCFEFKLVRRALFAYGSNSGEWQPGENLKIYSSNEKITITIGDFSNLNSYRIDTQEVQRNNNAHVNNHNNHFLDAPEESLSNILARIQNQGHAERNEIISQRQREMQERIAQTQREMQETVSQRQREMNERIAQTQRDIDQRQREIREGIAQRQREMDERISRILNGFNRTNNNNNN